MGWRCVRDAGVVRARQAALRGGSRQIRVRQAACFCHNLYDWWNQVSGTSTETTDRRLSLVSSNANSRSVGLVFMC